MASFLAFVLFAGCSGPQTGSAESVESLTAGADLSTNENTSAITFTDDLGRTLTIERPKRVAALIGSFADIWCLAGGQDTLAAAADDAWTSFELELGEDVASLGSVKSPNLETLLAASPDLITASCSTQADLELLTTFEQAGIPAAYFDVQSLDEYLHMLEICTQLTGCPENYELYGTQVQKRVEEASARQDGSSPTVLYIRASGSSCKVKGSDGSVLGEMLADLGCINIADSSSLFEDLSLEAILAADPDYIFAILQGTDPADTQATLEATLLSNPA